MNNKSIGIIAVLLAVFFWASTFAGTKLGLENISPYTLAFLRALIASIILLIIVLAQKQFKQVITIFKKHFFTVVILGIAGVFLIYVFQNLGLQRTSSAVGSVILNINPIFILILATLFLREKLSLNKILGIIIGFLGMALIVFSGESWDSIWQSQSFLGNILVLGAAVSWSVYSIVNKKISDKYGAYVLTLVSFIIGTILLLPMMLFFEETGAISTLPLKSWLIIIYLGLFGSGAALLTWNIAINKMDASKAAAFIYLIPVVAIIIGVLFLNESFTLIDIIGTGFVLIGIYLTEKKNATVQTVPKRV